MSYIKLYKEVSLKSNIGNVAIAEPESEESRMSKSVYSYVRDQWKVPSDNLKALQKQRLISYRREDASTKIERPTRIDRARSLGYKAKQGLSLIHI